MSSYFTERNGLAIPFRSMYFVSLMGLTEKAGENNLGEGEVATCHLGNKVVVQGGAWILRILRVRATIMAVKFNILLHWKGILAARPYVTTIANGELGAVCLIL